ELLLVGAQLVDGGSDTRSRKGLSAIQKLADRARMQETAHRGGTCERGNPFESGRSGRRTPALGEGGPGSTGPDGRRPQDRLGGEPGQPDERARSRQASRT